ncbi:extracellular solute-binding protein [Butyrivibrio sp. AE3004]|uniref:extracellular solute-binding protein n=1 Tax=Butyrivibrio sp. AE3004 TaxID=1506994 RepID=UPI0009DD029D|nr:extracellular solute-binding protein [Butyrivibrio sp. AE3004]
MHKRVLGFLIMVTLIVSLTTGCGGNKSETVDVTDQEKSDFTGLSSGNVTLRVWGAKEDEELINQIISSFAAQYKGQATFNISFEPHSEASCKDDLLGDVINAPDVFTFADDQLMSFIASGVLKKVENVIEITGRNIPAACSAASFGSTLYAYPLTADNGYFLFYNKKYVNEEDARTMDGLLGAADACGKKVFMEMNSGWYMYSFFGNTDMEIGLNDDGISTFCNWNAKYTDITGIDVAEAMARIGSNHAFSSVSNDGFAAGAADGTFVAGVSGIWDESAIKDAWGDDYEAVKLPTYTVAGQQLQMASYAGYKLVGVNSYSENADWAAKFADWMTNEQNQKLRFNLRGQGPSNIKASESEDVAGSKAIKALWQQADYSDLQRVGGKYWDAAATFGTLMSEGNPSGKDLQVLLNEMVTGITGEETTGDAPGQEAETTDEAAEDIEKSADGADPEEAKDTEIIVDEKAEDHPEKAVDSPDDEAEKPVGDMQNQYGKDAESNDDENTDKTVEHTITGNGEKIEESKFDTFGERLEGIGGITGKGKIERPKAEETKTNESSDSEKVSEKNTETEDIEHQAQK